MFGFNYIKFDSMTYAILYQNGQIVKEGKGLSFFYFAPKSSIAAVPTGSSDVNFIFKESTADFQEVSIQGQITYKVSDPKQLAELLDYTINKQGQFKTKDYEKLKERLINEAQAATASFIRDKSLIEAINSSVELEQVVSQGLQSSAAINQLGISTMRVNILAIKASPETQRALESKTREELLKQADLAIYERRNFSVEQERMIKQSELNTEIAIEEKKKEIAETQMDREVAEAENDRKIREMKVEADIAVEDKRKQLIETQVINDKKLADVKGYALEASIKPYRDLDWRILSAMGKGNQDAGSQIAMAFRELAENTSKIGTLNITPDLLEGLMQNKRK